MPQKITEREIQIVNCNVFDFTLIPFCNLKESKGERERQIFITSQARHLQVATWHFSFYTLIFHQNNIMYAITVWPRSALFTLRPG